MSFSKINKCTFPLWLESCKVRRSSKSQAHFVKSPAWADSILQHSKSSGKWAIRSVKNAKIWNVHLWGVPASQESPNLGAIVRGWWEMKHNEVLHHSMKHSNWWPLPRCPMQMTVIGHSERVCPLSLRQSTQRGDIGGEEESSGAHPYCALINLLSGPFSCRACCFSCAEVGNASSTVISSAPLRIFKVSCTCTFPTNTCSPISPSTKH